MVAILFASRQTPGLNGIGLAPFAFAFLLALLGEITGVMLGIIAVRQPHGCFIVLPGFAPGLLVGLIVGPSSLAGLAPGVMTLAVSVCVPLILERSPRVQ